MSEDWMDKESDELDEEEAETKTLPPPLCLIRIGLAIGKHPAFVNSILHFLDSPSKRVTGKAIGMC